MKILEKINDISASTVNSVLAEAKNDGEKIMGYFCSYVPEEIIHAAGFIPYRMRAIENNGTTLADTYFAPTVCSFTRQCFDKALNGDFDFLDGLIFMNGCDHNRRLYDNWRYAEIKPDFLHMLSVPHTMAESSIQTYKEDLLGLKAAIETRFGVTLTDDKIADAIRLYNRKRQLLSLISETRKREKVPIKGSEFLSIMLAITALPINTVINILESVLREMEGRVVNSDTDLRVFVSASCLEEVDHLQLIEESGSIVVADKICLGAPHYDTLVDEAATPFDALAERYLTHLSCPRMMDDIHRRLSYMHDQIDAYNVDAVISEKLEFCTLMAGEIFMHKKELAKTDLPFLATDRELYGGGTGQLKTRIQAFFEQVRNLKSKSGKTA
jgi:benzoyl-CoA reductase subunit C